MSSRPGGGTRPALANGAPVDVADTADRGCRQAARLESRGETARAQAAYLAILAAAPDHAPTLNRLGALLYRTGYTQAARTLYEQAVACHPDRPHGHVNLANLLREGGDLSGARIHYEAALAASPGLAQAHQGLGHVFSALGEAGRAAHHWRLGFRDTPLAAWPYRGHRPPIRVLMPISVADGNIAARPFLDDRTFAVTTLAMEFDRPALKLPPHDLVLNAVGDADLCAEALAAVRALLDRTGAPVINHPDRVLATGRAAMSGRLAGIADVITPRMALLARAPLAAGTGAAVLAERGFGWPVLLRAPGFHTGRHFVRVAAPADLAAALTDIPGEQVLAISCLDAAGPDGMVRKGRVMVIDGCLYPLHWAVSRHWKVHYFTADMAASAPHRAEEARFLADLPGFVGPRAMAGLAAIAARLGLDYGGIDFALGAHGEVLLFEANATMAIVAPPPDAVWDYRRPAAAAAIAATRRLLMARHAAAADAPIAATQGRSR